MRDDQVLTDLIRMQVAVYSLLQNNTLGEQIRLEQEQVGFQWLTAAIKNAAIPIC